MWKLSLYHVGINGMSDGAFDKFYNTSIQVEIKGSVIGNLVEKAEFSKAENTCPL